MELVPVSDLAKPSGAQAIDRAAHLLTAVVDAPHSVTFSELAESTGLARSTTSRLLTALERNGLLRREAGGAFVPGDAFVRYALRGNADTDLVAVATPFLERLGELSHETINLGVIRAGLVEQIAQVDSRFVLGGTNWLGRAEPVHATALGKVLLAFGSAELPAGRLKRLTASTVTSRSRLAEELATGSPARLRGGRRGARGGPGGRRGARAAPRRRRHRGDLGLGALEPPQPDGASRRSALSACPRPTPSRGCSDIQQGEKVRRDP